MFRAVHERFLREALSLARHDKVLPFPNPWVGCVVVKNGRIVGRGWHRGPGTDHAEIMALRQAGRRARGATLYVTLEPCCHWGRTPPCTDAILRARIQEVRYAIGDPNPEVAGRGARVLRAHGVRVHQGPGAREAATLNEIYLKYRATGLPFITVKVATTLDGKIATRAGESRWITDFLARRRARALRLAYQAVLVGVHTVLADNPNLGSRRAGKFEPWRVVLDSKLRTPPRSRVVRSRKCIIACASSASVRNLKRLERAAAKVWRFRGSSVPLRPLLKRLAREGILAILVEGGSRTLGSFFDAGLVDRACWFIAPVIVGSQKSLPAVGGHGVSRIARAWRLHDARVERVGACWFITGKVSRWAKAPE